MLYCTTRKAWLIDRVLESRAEPQSRARPNSMYFDCLPAEVFPTIIKYVLVTTDSQEEEELEGSMSTLSTGTKQILNLSMLFSDDSPFREAVSQLQLREVKLGQISDASRLWMDNGILVFGPEFFKNESLKLGIAERIFELCGESVKVVSFSIHWRGLHPRKSENHDVVQKFVRLVKLYCPNVENLKFGSLPIECSRYPFENIADELLEEFSSQLRSIEWNRYMFAKTPLRLPDISVCTNIRTLRFPASPQLIPFLRTFGASLDSLTLSFGDTNGCADMLDLIQRNCRKLSEVRLFGWFTIIEAVGEEWYARFLCSFGSQLIHAEIEELSIEKLNQVVRACPNLLIPILSVDGEGVDEWERAGLLGPMVKHLLVTVGMCQDEKCEESIGKCTNLEALTIQRDHTHAEGDLDNGSYLISRLPTSSSSVNYLKHYNFRATPHNINTLGLSCKNLHCLALYLPKPIENGIDFKSIARSNPLLNSVVIQEFTGNHHEREKDDSLEVLRMLVRSFSKCCSVLFILVNDGEESVTLDEVHDICSPLPCRGMNIKIRVGSTLYRQTD